MLCSGIIVASLAACERTPDDAAVDDTEIGTRLPVRDVDMARNFEGRALARVDRGSLRTHLRYSSNGPRARIQVEHIGRPDPGFDMIIENGRGLVLLHERRQYFSVDLAEVQKRDEREPEVRSVDHEGREIVAGLVCNKRDIHQGSLTIDACVRGIPGEFQTDIFEAVSGLDVPAWVEDLLGSGLWPARAVVTENGQRLYSVEILQYSPERVREQELSVPPEYERVELNLPVL